MNKSLLLLQILFASLLCAQTPEVKPAIAVTDLAAQGVSQNDAAVISEQLRSEIMASGKFKLIERSQMESILKEQGFQNSGCSSDACAVEMGQLLGVRYMVVGSLGQAGSYTVLTARMLDVKTAEILSTQTFKSKNGINLILEKGVQEVAGKIGESFGVKPVAKAPLPPTENKGESEKKPAKMNTTPIIIGGAGALVVGGGIAAFVLLTKKTAANVPGDNTTTPNVRMTLP